MPAANAGGTGSGAAVGVGGRYRELGPPGSGASAELARTRDPPRFDDRRQVSRRAPVSTQAGTNSSSGRSQSTNTPVNVAVFLGVEDAEDELGERLASADRLRDDRVSGFVGVSIAATFPTDCSTLQVIRGTKRSPNGCCGRPLPAPAAVAIITELAAALDALHARGEVHRELDPANVVFRTRTLRNPSSGSSIHRAASRSTKWRATACPHRSRERRQRPLDFRISGLCKSGRGEQRLDRRPLQRVFAGRDRV